MGIVSLPLHVWDREVDSRIFLAALLASDSNLVFFGHEYNLAPLYKCAERVFHFGAGRPIYNELERMSGMSLLLKEVDSMD